MNCEINNEVAMDLMVLYMSQSASPDTRKIVEAYLEVHPEVAVRFAKQTADAPVVGEFSALAKVRRALKLRNMNLAFAIACTLAPFTFWFDEGPSGIHSWMMVRDLPSLGCAFWAAAVGFWFGYWHWTKRTRATGL
jgi:anti-sigma factor RsiW